MPPAGPLWLARRSRRARASAAELAGGVARRGIAAAAAAAALSAVPGGIAADATGALSRGARGTAGASDGRGCRGGEPLPPVLGRCAAEADDGRGGSAPAGRATDNAGLETAAGCCCGASMPPPSSPPGAAVPGAPENETRARSRLAPMRFFSAATAAEAAAAAAAASADCVAPTASVGWLSRGVARSAAAAGPPSGLAPPPACGAEPGRSCGVAKGGGAAGASLAVGDAEVPGELRRAAAPPALTRAAARTSSGARAGGAGAGTGGGGGGTSGCGARGAARAALTAAAPALSLAASAAASRLRRFSAPSLIRAGRSTRSAMPTRGCGAASATGGGASAARRAARSSASPSPLLRVGAHGARHSDGSCTMRRRSASETSSRSARSRHDARVSPCPLRAPSPGAVPDDEGREPPALPPALPALSRGAAAGAAAVSGARGSAGADA
jgi:hypothetical protein